MAHANEDVGLLENPLEKHKRVVEDDGIATARAMYKKARADGNALLNPFALASAALLVGTFVDSVCAALYDVPLKYYLYDTLGVSVRTYYVLSACTSVPSSLLPFFGALSLVPIRGLAHKYWWIAGYAMSSACFVSLGMLPSPSFGDIAFWLSLASIGSTLCSTMTAMMLLERTREEKVQQRGLFAVYLATASYCGAFVGQILASLLYENQLALGHWPGLSIEHIFLIVGVSPLLSVLPLAFWLREVASRVPGEVREEEFNAGPPPRGLRWCSLFLLPRLRAEVVSSWRALCDPRVASIMTLAVAVTLLTVTNGAHSYLLLDGCGLSEPQYCYLKIAQTATLWCALVCYRTKLFLLDFRAVVVALYFLRTMAKFNDCLAVNFGGADAPVPCLLWVGGDDILYVPCDVIVQEILTIAILVVLSRKSSREASDRSASLTYLAMCAILNVAGSLSDIVDIKLEHIWDVSTAKLSAQNYSGYWRLELLTALVPLSCLCFINLLPRTRAAAAAKLAHRSPSPTPAELTGEGQRATLLACFFVALWVAGDIYVVWYDIGTAR